VSRDPLESHPSEPMTTSAWQRGSQTDAGPCAKGAPKLVEDLVQSVCPWAVCAGSLQHAVRAGTVRNMAARIIETLAEQAHRSRSGVLRPRRVGSGSPDCAETSPGMIGDMPVMTLDPDWNDYCKEHRERPMPATGLEPRLGGAAAEPAARKERSGRKLMAEPCCWSTPPLRQTWPDSFAARAESMFWLGVRFRKTEVRMVSAVGRDE